MQSISGSSCGNSMSESGIACTGHVFFISFAQFDEALLDTFL